MSGRGLGVSEGAARSLLPVSQHCPMRYSQAHGFTLVELLVVVAIIVVLATIAITQFQVYKTAAYNSVAFSDLTNSQIAQEAAYVDYGEYQGCADAAACELALPGFKATRDGSGSTVNALFRHVRVDEQSYTADARHLRGDVTYHFETGSGMVER